MEGQGWQPPWLDLAKQAQAHISRKIFNITQSGSNESTVSLRLVCILLEHFIDVSCDHPCNL